MKNSKPRIVILGAGFGGVYTIRELHKLFHGKSKIELVMINPTNYFVFTPLLHEVATGGVSSRNIVEPLRKILGCCLTDLYLTEAKMVNTRLKQVETEIGNIDYDSLVMAIGARTNFYNTAGAEKFCFTLKSIEDASRLKNHFILAFERASKITDQEEQKQLLRFVVVGGGPTGAELAAEMSDFFYDTMRRYYPCSQMLFENIEILLIQSQDRLVPQFPQKFSQKCKKILEKKHVKILLQQRVSEVQPHQIKLQDGQTILTETAIWVAGIQPKNISFDDPSIQRDTSDRILVDQNMAIPSHPQIFVLGDMACCLDPSDQKPVPALAQAATQQAKWVARTIHDSLAKNPPNPLGFRYRSSGTLISMGRWMALGEIRGGFFHGFIAWWLWRTIYLFKLISWRKRFEVAVDWTLQLFAPRDISELP